MAQWGTECLLGFKCLIRSCTPIGIVTRSVSISMLGKLIITFAPTHVPSQLDTVVQRHFSPQHGSLVLINSSMAI
jgi:hypothetical protein